MRDLLHQLRQAVVDEIKGSESYRVVLVAEAAELVVTGGGYDRLESAPKGYATNRPSIHWLRAKVVDVSTRAGSPDWGYDPSAIGKIQDILRSSKKVIDWLSACLGASTLTQEEIWAA